jgi:TM2 domain-containing membrane protein YozV
MKQLFKHKTITAGVAAIAGGITTIIAGNIVDGTQLILTGLIGIFLRDAIKKNNPNQPAQ